MDFTISEDTKQGLFAGASLVLLAWLFLSGCQLLIGMLDSGEDQGPWKRIEYVMPAYRLGWWLMQPPSPHRD